MNSLKQEYSSTDFVDKYCENKRQDMNDVCDHESDRRKSVNRKSLNKNNKAPQIQDFNVIKPISKGAFGKVYLGCRKDGDGTKYAIKVMRKEDVIKKNMINQVIAERNAMAVSRNVFIVHLYYTLQSNDTLYFIMEYMIGGDLKSLLTVFECFPMGMVQFYAAEIIRALEYLHSKHIVHRDLKPDNVLISATGHLKLTDFGLSEVREYNDLSVIDVINTPARNRTVQHSRFLRTPGQVLSLTMHLAFDETPKRHTSASVTHDSLRRRTVQSPLRKRHLSRVCASPALSRCQKIDSYPPPSSTSSLSDSLNIAYRRSTVSSVNVSAFSKDSSTDQSEVFTRASCSLSPDRFHKWSKGDTGVDVFPIIELEELESNRGDKTNRRVRHHVSSNECSEDDDDLSGIPCDLDLLPDCLESDQDSVCEKMENLNISPSDIKAENTSTEKGENSRFRVMGTPDYLAPELLLGSNHGPAVDFWALGVCIYEFIFGFPPFNDSTVHDVFNNILRRDIAFPEDTNENGLACQKVIESLLSVDPEKRPNSSSLRSHAFFSNIDFEHVHEMIAPFIPQPDDDTDTSYFEPRNNLRNIAMNSGLDL
ncbi:DgyrCDS9518 [Dimorphilus gyrociliatus]|uniref:Serine/threonine-protein kinase greatwall n=1 Tax=Dimorphilus gyrociliatus TaxID=2664684 RepID=A0A7I8VZY1_9ANNE|nr:DgyrCDS9518 [Dimorphilus gyrociliatus]